AASRMGQLIDDLLKLSRIGREQIRLENLDITQMCSELAAEYGGPIVQFHIQPGLVRRGDPRLIRFVLQNLIENAVKFSPSGGLIEIGSLDDGEIFVRD